MHYYYLTVAAPGAMMAMFYRGPQHPLHPEGLEQVQQDAGRQLTVLKRGQLVDPRAVSITWLYELPGDVAKARWPQDFESVVVPGEET